MKVDNHSRCEIESIYVQGDILFIFTILIFHSISGYLYMKNIASFIESSSSQGDHNIWGSKASKSLYSEQIWLKNTKCELALKV